MTRGLRSARRRRVSPLARAFLLVSAAAATALTPVLVTAAGQIKPDAACVDEAKYKSLRGEDKAKLNVINNSDEAVKVWWLNYDGERVLYRDLAPHTSYIQATWITHPWVISSSTGDCYRFLVMNALEQTVTVAPEVPDPASTVVPVTEGPATAPPPSARASTGAAAGSTVAPSGPTTPATSSEFTPLLILGVLASMAAVLVAGLAATGRLPGFLRGGRPPRP